MTEPDPACAAGGPVDVDLEARHCWLAERVDIPPDAMGDLVTGA